MPKNNKETAGAAKPEQEKKDAPVAGEDGKKKGAAKKGGK
eukprot:CAMPEP_0177716570 /NCGR_PEP_ID=MMETSP0484_2-20121128/14577_1 /TAXON_ID=354590 /ORGANISM="Rhodomonas lens, Strain RHODO" /LENGTH=39 /DNA_ID= /DNA_START= /DNA_END= /DNA_ORIENTATION=